MHWVAIWRARLGTAKVAVGRKSSTAVAARRPIRARGRRRGDVIMERNSAKARTVGCEVSLVWDMQFPDNSDPRFLQLTRFESRHTDIRDSGKAEQFRHRN